MKRNALIANTKLSAGKNRKPTLKTISNRDPIGYRADTPVPPLRMPERESLDTLAL